jgi:hypothetical protein
VKEALIGLLGVVLGLAGSTWTTLWSNRQNRQGQLEERLAARQEEASREIRQALISVHHLKHQLSGHESSGGPDELNQLIHTIDTYTMVLASTELRDRLKGATLVMWYWHLINDREHPIWCAVEDATACIGAYLRGESLPEISPVMRQLIDNANEYDGWVSQHIDT